MPTTTTKTSVKKPRVKKPTQDDLWNTVYSFLDQEARDFDSYEFGLPWSETKDNMIKYLKSRFKLIEI